MTVKLNLQDQQNEKVRNADEMIESEAEVE